MEKILDSGFPHLLFSPIGTQKNIALTLTLFPILTLILSFPKKNIPYHAVFEFLLKEDKTSFEKSTL